MNLGGVANLTWCNHDFESPESDGSILAFDTGPANAVIDDLVFQRTGKRFDDGGAIASRGNVIQDIVADFMRHRYFDKVPPKSCDRDEFVFLMGLVSGLSTPDAIATATACTAAAVARGFEFLPRQPSRVLLCGGGRRNPVLMRLLKESLRRDVMPVEDCGMDGDMLEAQAFGYLAVRVLRGLPISAPATTGCNHPVVGGIVCVP